MDWLDAASLAEEYWEGLSNFESDYCAYNTAEEPTSSVQDVPHKPSVDLVVPKLNFEIPPPRRKKSGKSKWTTEEDNRLKSLAKSMRCEWAKIAKHFPNMTISAIQRRWNNKLDPNIKKTRWTKEEDDLILKLYTEIKGNWKIISQHLEGRPPNAIKNRFYGALKRRMPQAEPVVEHKPVHMIQIPALAFSEDAIVNSFLSAENDISEGLLGEEAMNMLSIDQPVKGDELTPESRKKRIDDLYSRMSSIEGVLLSTQLQIRELEEQISIRLRQ